MNRLIRKDKVLLRPSDLQPLCPDCEVVGVFNPAAARHNGDIILLVRVVEQPRPQRVGQLLSPRAVWQDERITWELDAFDLTKVDASDLRLIYLPDGRARLRYISHLRLVRLNPGGTRVEEVRSLPDLLPCEPWEECGIEDPRITQIGDTYYITYVAISRQMGIATALMTTHDFQTFERHGIIFPTENKNLVTFVSRGLIGGAKESSRPLLRRCRFAGWRKSLAFTSPLERTLVVPRTPLRAARLCARCCLSHGDIIE